MNTLMLVSKRNLKGYSQEQTAKMLGLSSVQYGKKERGEKDFKANEIKKLKILFDLSDQEIISIFFWKITYRNDKLNKYKLTE